MLQWYIRAFADSFAYAKKYQQTPPIICMKWKGSSVDLAHTHTHSPISHPPPLSQESKNKEELERGIRGKWGREEEGKNQGQQD